jgi:hypothetical protein
MARPKKQAQTSEKKVQTNAEELKELKFLAEIRDREKEILYKDLAILKDLVDLSLTQIGFIDSSESLGEAAFKAGRAYVPLDKANDKLTNMLDNMYDAGDFDHYEDVIEDMNDQLLN